MKNKIIIAVVVIATSVYSMGCGSAQVKKDALSKVKYAGILSVTGQEVLPENTGNTEVIQQTVNYAFSQVENRLKSVRSFKTVSVLKYYKYPDFRDAGILARSKGAQAFLKKKVNSDPNFAAGAGVVDTASAMQALFGGGLSQADTINNINNITQKQLNDARNGQAVTTGLPFMPYGAFYDENPNTTEIRAGDSKKKENILKEMLLADVAELCGELKLDAMIVVYVDTAVKDVGGVRVISGGDRVLGTVRLNMTMLVIDKNGEIIANLGWPSMDDVSPGKMLMPAHIVTSWAYSAGHRTIKTMAADLKDPEGRVPDALKELVVESSTGMIEDLKKAIGEIE